MRASGRRVWLRNTALALAALAMLLVCHAAYSPYNILPSGMDYAVYPVGDFSVPPLKKGDLAVCRKSAELRMGGPVKYVSHPLSSFALSGVPVFGYMLEYSGRQGTVTDMYKVQIIVDGQGATLNSARPEPVLYRISGLGSVILGLHRYRYAVLCVCAAIFVACIVTMWVTAKSRRLRQSREQYIKLFESYAQKFENDGI